MNSLDDSTFFTAMQGVKRRTTKYQNYFSLYDLVIKSLPDNPCVLEIGIANGGSLETWRSLFPEPARIIGIDLNEQALLLREEGFEIFLLDTGREKSWELLEAQLSDQVDLLVDDGGHTNTQQILAISRGLALVRPGGWLVIEDVHASFMKSFGNPSRHSASSFLSRLAADLHRLHPRSDSAVECPNIAKEAEFMLQSSSWVAIKKRVVPSNESDFAEVSYGNDASLMDFDHRWDSLILSRRLQRLAPKFVRSFFKSVMLKYANYREVRSLIKKAK